MGFLRYIIITGLFFLISANATASGKWQSPEFVDGTESVDLEQAEKLHAMNVLFIDVRSSRQYGKRHIPGAINLFVNDGFSEQNLLKNIKKETPFVVYCNGTHCSLSYKAATAAVAWGFTGVKYFRGGARAWRLGGNPLEYGAQ